MATDVPSTLGRELGYSAPPSWASLALSGPGDEPPELQWPNSIRTYERMTYDAQVRQVMNAIVLPMLSPTVLDPATGQRVKGRWCIKRNGARDEVVDHCSGDLALPIEGQPAPIIPRSRGRFSYREHLRIALWGALAYGFMPFEQFGELVWKNGVPRWHLRKLDPRPPDTISEIKTNKTGGLDRIEQYPPGTSLTSGVSVVGWRHGTQTIPIPVDVLVWYAHDMLPGRWLGRSLLRSAYKNWLIKDRLLRVDATKHERNGMGVPVGELGPNPTVQDLASMQAVVERFRAGDTSGGTVPNGGRIRLVGVEGSLPDTLGSIKYQDEQIVALMMTQFLKLGMTETGARSVGETQHDFFQLVIDSLIEWAADIGSEHIVEDLVDWNWTIDEAAPRIGVEPDPDVETAPPPPAPEPPANPPTARRPAPRGTRGPEDVSLPARSLRRQPYDHEVAAMTDFEAIEATFLEHRDQAVETWQAVRAGQIEELTQAVETLVDEGNYDALANLMATSDGADELAVIMEGAATEAMEQAIQEAAAQGIDLVAPDLDLDSIHLRAAQMEDLMARAISDSASRAAVRMAGAGLSGNMVANNVRDHLNSLTDSYLEEQLGGAIVAAQNHARRAVIGQAPARVYASELLDTATCENCREVDGRSYSSVSEADVDYPTGGYLECRGGARCRGTLIGVYAEATA